MISIDEREDVRLGGGGLGGWFEFELADGVMTREEGGMEVEDKLEEALFLVGGGGGDLRLGARLRLAGEPSLAGWEE